MDRTFLLRVHLLFPRINSSNCDRDSWNNAAKSRVCRAFLILLFEKSRVRIQFQQIPKGSQVKSSNKLRVAFIGNHTPRQCGIATFTADIAKAVGKTGAEVQILAINDRVEGYDYPDCVHYQIDQFRPESYFEAARYLNAQAIDVICVQHEFGIFGGDAGAHLLLLLREVNAPIVTTLHTILQQPNPAQREVMTELIQLSERLVVMTERGRSILADTFQVAPDKVEVVPHGIPNAPRQALDLPSKEVDLTDKKLILTFGLIAPDKGIEHMILAMPAIVKAHPDAYYLVVGATHPNIRQQSGETYRASLVDLACELNVSQNIGFVDRFIDIGELTSYLQATSIYVTPYLKREQITSGTLAYAFGCGNAVVSTPYWHAEELLADGKGILVPFRDPNALSSEIVSLLSDPHRLEEVQARAYAEGRNMLWSAIGQEYVRVYSEAQESSRTLFPDFRVMHFPAPDDLSVDTTLGLEHLLTLTDDTGILQHATHSVPNRHEGYCTDDNARLAIVASRLELCEDHRRLARSLQHKALSFLHHAYNPRTEHMRNFMGFDRQWFEEKGSPDSHARSIWGLGVLLDESSSPGVRAVSRELFQRCLAASNEFIDLRSIAFTILGLAKALNSRFNEHWFALLHKLSLKLHQAFLDCATLEWAWFEGALTYDNARLPQALLIAGHLIEDENMVSDACIALTWLCDLQTDRFGCFHPIGSNGFMAKGGDRAYFDQQPVEAAAIVDACAEAYRILGDSFWKAEAWKAYRWFYGDNSEQICLVDEVTGGCRDGLMDKGVNENQGAESTLAYLASSLAVMQLERMELKSDKRYLG